MQRSFSPHALSAGDWIGHSTLYQAGHKFEYSKVADVVSLSAPPR
jgi:hypothetical protein